MRRLLSLLWLSAGASICAAETDLGLRALATTWETDDDNSILQLVGVPSAGSGNSKVSILGGYLWYDSPENSNFEVLPCAMAFRPAGPSSSAVFFFATGDSLGPVRIYTIDAVTGQLILNVSLPAASAGSLVLSSLAYNNATGELDALAYAGTAPPGRPQAVAVDPVTGAFRILADALPLPDFQGPCEAALASHVRAGSRLYFVQQDAVGWQKQNCTYLMALNLTTGAAGRLLPWSPKDGMLSNVAAVDAATAGDPELLLYTTSAWDQDLNETADLTIWALAPEAAAAAFATAATAAAAATNASAAAACPAAASFSALPVAVATIANPQAGDGPLLPTWGTLSVFGDGPQRTVTMVVTNNNGRIYTYVVELNVTVAGASVVAAGAPRLTAIDDSDVTGGMIYRMNRVVTA